LSVVAIVGLFALLWRSYSSDRNSRAALRQANNSMQQIHMNAKNSQITQKQLSLLMEKQEHEFEKYKSDLKIQKFDILLKCTNSLQNAATAEQRVACIHMFDQLCRIEDDFLWPSRKIIYNTLQHIYPANPNDAQEMHFETIEVDDDANKKIEFLEKLPVSLFLRNPVMFQNTSPSNVIKRFAEQKGVSHIDANDEAIINFFIRAISVHDFFVLKDHVYKSKAEAKIDLQSYLEFCSEIKRTHTFAGMKMSRMDFDGLTFTHLALKDALASFSTFRGAQLAGTDFTNAVLVGTDFACATINEADFSDADLSYSDFSNAMWISGSLDGANVDKCIFDKTINFSSSHLHNAKNAETAFIKE
jgi:hypothetical protein